MFDVILLLLVGFAGGCIATLFFARANQKKFFRYMTTDLEVLMKNTQDEIKNATDTNKAKLAFDKMKATLDGILKKNL
jgi:hypothetical protein